MYQTAILGLVLVVCFWSEAAVALDCRPGEQKNQWDFCESCRGCGKFSPDGSRCQVATVAECEANLGKGYVPKGVTGAASLKEACQKVPDGKYAVKSEFYCYKFKDCNGCGMYLDSDGSCVRATPETCPKGMIPKKVVGARKLGDACQVVPKGSYFKNSRDLFTKCYDVKVCDGLGYYTDEEGLEECKKAKCPENSIPKYAKGAESVEEACQTYPIPPGMYIDTQSDGSLAAFYATGCGSYTDTNDAKDVKTANCPKGQYPTVVFGAKSEEEVCKSPPEGNYGFVAKECLITRCTSHDAKLDLSGWRGCTAARTYGSCQKLKTSATKFKTSNTFFNSFMGDVPLCKQYSADEIEGCDCNSKPSIRDTVVGAVNDDEKGPGTKTEKPKTDTVDPVEIKTPGPKKLDPSTPTNPGSTNPGNQNGQVQSTNKPSNADSVQVTLAGLVLVTVLVALQ